MYQLNPLNQSKAIFASAKSVGAKLPAAVHEAHDRAQRIVTSSQTISPDDGGNLATAVHAALDAGRDPATDPEVARYFLAFQLVSSNVDKPVADIAASEFITIMQERADDVILSLDKPFTKAVETMVASHKRIGDLPLNDTASIMRRGDDIAAVWTQAAAAVSNIAAINTAWLALASITRLATNDNSHAPLRIATASHEQWSMLGEAVNPKTATAWDLLVLGLDLSLATFAEFARRVAAINTTVDAYQ